MSAHEKTKRSLTREVENLRDSLGNEHHEVDELRLKLDEELRKQEEL